jgi:hypothetical protein
MEGWLHETAVVMRARLNPKSYKVLPLSFISSLFPTPIADRCLAAYITPSLTLEA